MNFVEFLAEEDNTFSTPPDVPPNPIVGRKRLQFKPAQVVTNEITIITNPGVTRPNELPGAATGDMVELASFIKEPRPPLSRGLRGMQDPQKLGISAREWRVGVAEFSDATPGMEVRNFS
jgi:hypothetical protein